MNETLRKLYEKRAAAVAAMRKLLDAADNENRSMTGEEETAYQRWDADVDALNQQIAREERVATLENEQRESANADRNPQQRRQPGTGAPEQRDATATPEYRSAMLRYMISGMADPQLRTDSGLGGERRDILGVSLTGSGATGAILAPTALEKSLLKDIENANVVRRLADVRSSVTDVDIPYATAHTTAYLIAEGAAFTASTPAFAKKTLKAYKAGALSYVTTEAMQDMFIDMEAWIRDDFARAFADLEETHFISGTGTAQPSGLLTGGTAAVTAASATALTADEMLDLIYSCPAQYRKNASFLMNDSTIKALRKLKDGNQQYLWQPGAQAGQPDRFMGYAIHTSSSMPEIAAGNKAVVFGDFKQYRILDRRGLYFQRLNELYATSGQVGFLAYRRYDAAVMQSAAIRLLTMKSA